MNPAHILFKLLELEIQRFCFITMTMYNQSIYIAKIYINNKFDILLLAEATIV